MRFSRRPRLVRTSTSSYCSGESQPLPLGKSRRAFPYVRHAVPLGVLVKFLLVREFPLRHPHSPVSVRPMQTPRPEAQGAPLRQHPRDSRILMRAIWLLDGLQVLQTGSLGAVPSNWLIATTGDYLKA